MGYWGLFVAWSPGQTIASSWTGKRGAPDREIADHRRWLFLAWVSYCLRLLRLLRMAAGLMRSSTQSGTGSHHQRGRNCGASATAGGGVMGHLESPLRIWAQGYEVHWHDGWSAENTIINRRTQACLRKWRQTTFLETPFSSRLPGGRLGVALRSASSPRDNGDRRQFFCCRSIGQSRPIAAAA